MTQFFQGSKESPHILMKNTREALNLLTVVKDKRDGKIKGRVCANISLGEPYVISIDRYARG